MNSTHRNRFGRATGWTVTFAALSIMLLLLGTVQEGAMLSPLLLLRFGLFAIFLSAVWSYGYRQFGRALLLGAIFVIADLASTHFFAVQPESMTLGARGGGLAVMIVVLFAAYVADRKGWWSGWSREGDTAHTESPERLEETGRRDRKPL